MLNFLLFIVSLLVVVKSADSAIKYSSKLASSMCLSKQVVGFLIVSTISVMPETLISVLAAFEGVPSFGLGTLFGSNVADLSLVFVLILLFGGRDLHVSSKILKDKYLFFLCLAVPMILGLNGYYSGLEGIMLILVGILFHIYALQRDKKEIKKVKAKFSFSGFLLLILSMGLLLLASHFTVESGVVLAKSLNISPIFIGMFVVGLGTTLPETLFSIKAVRHHFDSLALGDMLGTVMTDATIVLGLVAVICPFAFEERLVYITGLFMFLGALVLFYFMQSEKKISYKEGLYLLLFYLLFVLTEFLVK